MGQDSGSGGGGSSMGQAASMGIGGLISPISRMFLARKQRKMAAQINPVRTYYQTSPYASENKGLAVNQMNGQMAGSESMQDGINASQQGTINSANRNATSSADALAVASGSQTAANRAYENLGTMQNQWKQQGLGNVMNANRDLISEGDKVYQDKYADYQEKTQAKNALIGASLQNQYGAWSDIGNTLMGAGSALFGAGGSGGSGGGGGGGMSPAMMQMLLAF